MKIVLASDSFKGSLSAAGVANLLEQAARRVFPGVQTVSLPIADGGEGTVEALVLARGGRMETAVVAGPLGGEREAKYGVLDGNIAVMEMAETSGIGLVTPGQLDPLRATTQGVGQLLAHLVDEGYGEVWIGIGGSATNDGGMGALRALGAEFTDKNGAPVPEGGGYLTDIERVDLSGLHTGLKNAKLRVICDVNNTLLGPEGATMVYGPQKGADRDMLAALEQGMAHYAEVFLRDTGIDLTAQPGGGAAGGLGAALLCVLHAEFCRGIDEVLSLVEFDKHVADADLVVTGEGRIDAQSVSFGKAVSGVIARSGDIPVAIIAGSMSADAKKAYERGNVSIMTAVNAPMPVETAVAQARELVADAAYRMFAFIGMGMKV